MSEKTEQKENKPDPVVQESAATPKPEAVQNAAGRDDAPTEDGDRSRGRRRASKTIPAGIAFVKSTFNNTLVSITDVRGNVLSWGSAGRSGFKGSRKSTAFSATMVAQDAARQAMAKGMHEVEVRVQGAGSGRESAVRAIQSAGITVSSVKDTTPIPHNGCRPRKRRRV